MELHFPLVSVIVPAYNAEDFIEQTLNSVLSQTYTNLEVVVVDDGSQDRTAEIVESIAQKDQRVILLQQSNAGVGAARNLAIQKSSGEFIAPMDADDIWYPQKIEKQVKCMLQANPSVGLVYAWTVLIDEKDSILGLVNNLQVLDYLEGEVYTGIVYRNFIGSASVPLIRRACFEQVGGYNCQFKELDAQGCEDWDLYLRIAEFYQFRVVPEYLIGYRQIMGSMSGNWTAMARSYHLVMAESQRRHPEIPNTIYQLSTSMFYVFLMWKSCGCGDHWNTLLWLCKAIRLDFALLSNFWVYKLLVMCILKLAAKPVTSLIWPEHRSWLQFRKRFNLAHREHQVITIDDINRQINKPQPLPQNLYERLLLQRWERVVQSCQTVYPSVKGQNSYLPSTQG